jgi:uncharacterized protein (DUF2062 family)
LALRDKLSSIFSVKDSPQKIALSFSVGVFFGMSPFLGLHTILGIAAAWLFRLNKFVTIVGVYITNPWTIVPIYTFATWFGAKLLGIKQIIPAINYNDISLPYLIVTMKHLLLPFVVGTTFIGLLSALVGYLIIYQAIVRSRKD